KAAKLRLALAADVEEAGVERHRHREPGEDEARGIVERVTPTIGRSDRALDHRPERLGRALPDGEDDEGGDDASEEKADGRHEDEVGPAGKLRSSEEH